MGWTDLFKSNKLKADPRIRWFGKLPTYPDYYSSPADEEWAVEFNDWVLKGFEVYQSRLKGQSQTNRRLPISGCVIRLPRTGMTVFASVLDYGGDMRGRPFPVCFYVGIPTVNWPGPTSATLAGAVAAIREMLDLRRDVVRFLNSPGRFESVFGERAVNLTGTTNPKPDNTCARAKAISFEEWFNSARSGLKIQEPHRWRLAVDQWGQNLMRHDGRDFQPTLRFPLAMRMPYDWQIAGWIRWLESRINVGRRTFSLVVSGEPSQDCGSLTVIARDVLREDFLLLTPLSRTVPYLDDLLAFGDGFDDGNTPGLTVGLDAVIDGPASSWLDFVEAKPSAR